MPTNDKNFMAENVSYSDRILQRVFKPKIFGQFLYFDDLQPFTYL